MVQMSTDYVFDGRASSPYEPEHRVRPRSAYGRTKAAGEWAARAEAPRHLVVRTAWLYGAHGSCFPRTIARAAREKGSVYVVDDQRGQPTWTRDVADLVERLVAAGLEGTHHATSGGETTWFQFAEQVCRAAGLPDGVVSPTTSEHFVRPAPRPAYSVLGHDSLRAAGIEPIGDWRERWQVAAGEVLGAG
jgi:dTDP-4-dehydrorhamnose reductase